MIAVEVFGSSFLGEVWYAEADTPLGPWVYARKIVTHDDYSFYNPKQHPLFDQEDGRILFFEGTYTSTFSGNKDPTPRYDYNQVMYQLDLADHRLALPVAIYAVMSASSRVRLDPATAMPEHGASREIAFFAPDRPGLASVPVRESRDGNGDQRLIVAGGAADPKQRRQGDRSGASAFLCHARRGRQTTPGHRASLRVSPEIWTCTILFRGRESAAGIRTCPGTDRPRMEESRSCEHPVIRTDRGTKTMHGPGSNEQTPPGSDDDLSLEGLAAELQKDPEECWRAFQGLESVDVETRLRIIAGLSRLATNQGVIGLLRLLSDSTDAATRQAARAVLNAAAGPSHQIVSLADEGRVRPRLVSCLVTAVDGTGRGSIVLLTTRTGRRATAAFLCDLRRGIIDVSGQLEEETEQAGRLVDEVREQAGADAALAPAELAIGLLAACLGLNSPPHPAQVWNGWT